MKDARLVLLILQYIALIGNESCFRVIGYVMVRKIYIVQYQLGLYAYQAVILGLIAQLCPTMHIFLERVHNVVSLYFRVWSSET